MKAENKERDWGGKRERMIDEREEMEGKRRSGIPSLQQ